jgi:hypothetical protein
MSRRMYDYLDDNCTENEPQETNPLKFAIIATIVIILVIYILVTYFI